MDDFTMQAIEDRVVLVRHKDGHVFRFQAGQDGWSTLTLMKTLPGSGASSRDAHGLNAQALDFASR